ncbi:hypothetical protein SARC_01707 [Sphaeroforma arctica JP610]|uniref:EF-hand domain-containing protein n=1 Tax=Sphaeroforma arctica JP610 TaxID=667725 RepID=A0A0L0GD31_9EUKA|nr:hypothetical protein SARC_01707 [Sphaeroforma arctica JP610]KNC86138.1 hypothetical protein SARC_01707 [Sphaeroforma arctica JP610]|eukprot:XP_014160040.1 hypothetical protein SARC_01707 [Sphaeroforma arctica JP610]
MTQQQTPKGIFKQLADKEGKVSPTRVPIFLRAAGLAPSQSQLAEVINSLHGESVDRAKALELYEACLKNWGTQDNLVSKVTSNFENGSLSKMLSDMGDELTKEEVVDVLKQVNLESSASLHDFAEVLLAQG